MNDDLEQELSRLRPAAPPPALLHRLHACPPRARSPWWQRLLSENPVALAPWQVTATGAMALLVLTLVLRGLILPSAAPTGSVSIRPTGSSPAPVVAAADPAPLTQGDHASQASDPSTLAPGAPGVALLDSAAVRVDLGGNYAALGSALLPTSASGFDLEVPTGPIRLNCGGLPLVNDGSERPFGRLNLPFRHRF